MESTGSQTFDPTLNPTWSWRIRKALQGANPRRLSREDIGIRDLTGKWVIISGSNNGIGREAALLFAQSGANIILACRDPPSHEVHPADVEAECRTLSRSSGHESSVIEWWKIDMARLVSVHAFADRWLESGRALDILCNNAGVGGNPGDARKVCAKTEDGFEFVHQVNFLSHCLLTLRFLPSLARADRPRVVCTTSCMQFLGSFDIGKFNGEGCRGEDFYCNNKLWLQVWLTELQHRMLACEQYKHIVINGVHPGYTNTGIWHVAREPGWLNWLRGLPEAVLVTTLARVLAISAMQGSYAIVHAAFVDRARDMTNAKVGFGTRKGTYFNRIWETEAMPHCHDENARRMVWAEVLKELKLSEEGHVFLSTSLGTS